MVASCYISVVGLAQGEHEHGDVEGDEYLLMLGKNGDVGAESECLC